MATNVLKPGGYERFFQIAGLLAGAERRERTWTWTAVTELAARVASGRDYQKPIKPAKPHKIDAELPLMSCFTAPCRTGCPIQQDIRPTSPAWTRQVRRGPADHRGAQRPAAHHRQPLPAPLRRQVRAQLSNEPEGARIREHKLTAAHEGFDEVVKALRAAGPSRLASAADKNVAVVGGGPAGLATAFFLTRAGAKVTINRAHG